MVLTSASFLSCPVRGTPTPGQPRLACHLPYMLRSQTTAPKHPKHPKHSDCATGVGATEREGLKQLNRSQQPTAGGLMGAVQGWTPVWIPARQCGP